MVTVENLSFTYQHPNPATIKSINFEIEKGEVFGFLGPSGSGKSTTQKVMCGLLKGYQGSAKLLGKEVNQWGRGLYENIGVGFELPNHYESLSAEENLALFASMYSQSQSADYLLERVGLLEDKKKLVANFSKGMKMRLNFARALLGKPEILFLDEPTSGLDPVNAAKIKEYIKELQVAGVTVFLTTHNMHDAEELCDNIGFIVDGEITKIDSPHRMKQEYGRDLVEVTYKDAGRDKLEVFSKQNLGSNSSFLELIARHEIQAIHSLEASLDDVFIELTGKSLK